MHTRLRLNAVLRALFSMPDQEERDQIGDLVRQYVTGPGRPQIFDGFAKSETSFVFALGRRRSFQKRWFGLSMRSSPPAGAHLTMRAIKTCSIS
jgi:hypothetical protein